MELYFGDGETSVKTPRTSKSRPSPAQNKCHHANKGQAGKAAEARDIAGALQVTSCSLIDESSFCVIADMSYMHRFTVTCANDLRCVTGQLFKLNVCQTDVQ